jgi:hypothetical protein
MASTTAAAVTTITTPETSTTRLDRPFYERSCASRIATGYGPPDIEIAIYEVGPLSFLDLDVDQTAAMAPSQFESRDGRHLAHKYVTVVDGDALGPVDLLIEPRNRSSVGLVYDPAMWAQGALTSTDSMVRFEGCAGLDAQFNGGFLITEPTCVYFSVIESGNNPPLVSFGAIPFGVPAETCVADKY